MSRNKVGGHRVGVFMRVPWELSYADAQLGKVPSGKDMQSHGPLPASAFRAD